MVSTILRFCSGGTSIGTVLIAIGGAGTAAVLIGDDRRRLRPYRWVVARKHRLLQLEAAA